MVERISFGIPTFRPDSRPSRVFYFEIASVLPDDDILRTTVLVLGRRSPPMIEVTLGLLRTSNSSSALSHDTAEISTLQLMLGCSIVQALREWLDRGLLKHTS
jgi:hypothetical protein